MEVLVVVLLKRPALQQLFNRLDQFDLVLVYKLDRLTRNVRDLLEMLERFENMMCHLKVRLKFLIRLLL